MEEGFACVLFQARLYPQFCSELLQKTWDLILLLRFLLFHFLYEPYKITESLSFIGFLSHLMETVAHTVDVAFVSPANESEVANPFCLSHHLFHSSQFRFFLSLFICFLSLFLSLYFFFIRWIKIWNTCIVLIIFAIILIIILTFFYFLILFLLVCLVFKGFVWEFLSLEWVIFELGKPKPKTPQLFKFLVCVLIIPVSLSIFPKFSLSPSKLIGDNMGHQFSQEDMTK